MKKGRFLWSAHRITERQKAGKARSIKGKQLKNSRNTVSKQLVEHHSSQNVNLYNLFEYTEDTQQPRKCNVSGVFLYFHYNVEYGKTRELLTVSNK